jgi:ElaB/YqjD/DUF883 family membrane-anchored ribosome-binding protein
MIHNIKAELKSITEELENTLRDAEKFDRGVDAAGTRVRNACQEARGRLFGLRNMVLEVRKERKAK